MRLRLAGCLGGCLGGCRRIASGGCQRQGGTRFKHKGVV